MVYKNSMKKFNDDDNCFVCGSRNPHGLQLDFHFDEESGEVTARTDFAGHFQGWEGVLHGGLLSTVLDEVMIKSAIYGGYKCVTVELNVRFRKPARLEKSFTVRGKVTEAQKRLVFAEGAVIDSDDVTVATATGKFMTVG
jgi:uncharacterized protein (TIGR00369 family)